MVYTYSHVYQPPKNLTPSGSTSTEFPQGNIDRSVLFVMPVIVSPVATHTGNHIPLRDVMTVLGINTDKTTKQRAGKACAKLSRGKTTMLDDAGEPITVNFFPSSEEMLVALKVALMKEFLKYRFVRAGKTRSAFKFKDFQVYERNCDEFMYAAHPGFTVPLEFERTCKRVPETGWMMCGGESVTDYYSYVHDFSAYRAVDRNCWVKGNFENVVYASDEYALVSFMWDTGLPQLHDYADI